VSDRRGQAQALTLLAPIVPGREEGLRAALEALPDGAASPLAKLPGTHFARFVIVPEPLPSKHLLFSACFDGKLGPWLAALCVRIPKTADELLGACNGYPGCADTAVLASWVDVHRLRSAAFTGGYLHAPLDQVCEALALRERLRAFAPRAQHMAATDLQAAFRETFPP
jgi:hypothetical protein